ncbi:DMT family transporter [Gulbenkiania mobilis]|uniref:DMT family transporter n=1 Tax=Gulbenkiania mobilis TaxID=397457 RepID=UPI0009F8AED8|nr:DMT family transporter [Gulbenkiania mobilis]
MTPSSSRMATVLLVATMFLWSTNFVLARALHEAIGPFSLAFLRWGVALLCLLPFALPRLRRNWTALRRQWKALCLMGVFGIGLTNTLVYLAVKTTTATNAVILNSATPVIVLLLSAAWFRQRLSGRQCAGMVVALAGAVFIVCKGELAGLARFHFSPGDVLILGAGLAWAVYTVSLRTLRPGLDALVQMAAALAIGEMVLLPGFLWEISGQGATLAALSGGTWGLLAYLGLFPSILAFLMYNRAIGLAGPARAASFLYLMPAFGALLSVLALGESLHAFHVAGLAAIFAGIVLGSYIGSFPTVSANLGGWMARLAGRRV